MKKRVLSLLMAFALCLSLVPTAWAEDDGGDTSGEGSTKTGIYVDGEEYTGSFAEALENSPTTIDLYEDVTVDDGYVYSDLTVNMNGHSITGDLALTMGDVVLSGGTVVGTIIALSNDSFTMTAPADAEAAIDGGLEVTGGACTVSGAKTGVKGTLYISSDETVTITGTEKAVELTGAASGKLYGSADVDGDAAAEAVFEGDTYTVNGETARKLSNVQANAPAEPTLEISPKTANLLPGSSAEFTVTYTGDEELVVYIQKSAADSTLSAAKEPGTAENTWIITVTATEEAATGTYYLHVYPEGKDSQAVTAEITVAEAVAKDSEGNFYTDIRTAVEETPDGGTLTILKSVSLPSGLYAPKNREITIDLNGHTLSGYDLNVGTYDVYGNPDGESKLTVIDSGHGNGQIGITVREGGEFVFAPDSTGTKLTSLNVYDKDKAKVSLSGGNIDASQRTVYLYNGISLYDIIADGYAYRRYYGSDSFGDWVTSSRADQLTGQISGTYAILKCEHQNVSAGEKCGYCGEELVATVTPAGGESTGFTAIEDAFAAASENAGSTLLLLADIDNSSSPSYTSGEFTINLCGHSLASLLVGTVDDDDESDDPAHSPAVITVTNTITTKGGIDQIRFIEGTVNLDGSDAVYINDLQMQTEYESTANISQGAVRDVELEAENGVITFNGGTGHATNGYNWIISKGKLVINDGSFGSVMFKLQESASVKLFGGSFGEIDIENGETYYSPALSALLGEGRAFFDSSDAVVNASAIYNVSNVTVKPHTHTYKDGSCTGCGAECEHENGVENGVCPDCGKAMVDARLTAENGDVSYGTIEELLSAEGRKNGTITLLRDCTSQKAFWTGPFTLDLNGKTLQAEGNGIRIVKDVTIKNGTIKGSLGEALLLVTDGAKLTLNANIVNEQTWSQNRNIANGVRVYSGGTLIMTGGTIDGGLHASKGSTVELSGGTLKKQARASGFSYGDGNVVALDGDVGALLKTGYAYKYENGNLMDISSPTKKIGIGTTVTIVRCEDHSYSSATGRCIYCNTECEHVWDENSKCTICKAQAVAILGGSTYFIDFADALTEGAKDTSLELKLLKDVTGDYSTERSINLGGYAINGTLTVTGGSVEFYNGGIKKLDMKSGAVFAYPDSAHTAASIDTLTIPDGANISDMLTRSALKRSRGDGSSEWLTDLSGTEFISVSVERAPIESLSAVLKLGSDEKPIGDDNVIEYCDIGTFTAKLTPDSIGSGCTVNFWMQKEGSEATKLPAEYSSSDGTYTYEIGFTEVTTYTVWCEAEKDGYKLTSAKGTLTVKADLSKAQITKDNTGIDRDSIDYEGNLVYTAGKELTRNITVKFYGLTLTENTDFVITGVRSATEAGEYELTIKPAEGSVYSGEQTFKWKIVPRILSDLNIANNDYIRSYDGTTEMTVENTVFGKYPATFTDALNGGTLELTKDEAEVTKLNCNFTSPDAETSAVVDYTIKLKTKNYTFEDNAGNALSEKTFTKTMKIKAAYLPDSAKPEEGSITVKNECEETYKIDLTELLKKLDTPLEYGNTVYQLRDDFYFEEEGGSQISVKANGLDSTYCESLTVDKNSGILTLKIKNVDTENEGSIGSVKVMAHFGNFQRYPITVTVYAENKVVPTGKPTLDKNEITYGDKIGSIKLGGTLHDDINNCDVTGTFEWVSESTVPEVGSGTYEAEWTFTPDDTSNYKTATGTSEIKVSPKNIEGVVVTASGNEFVYDGTVQVPEITEVAFPGGATLSKDTDYELQVVKSGENVGDYSLKVVGKGNYTGSVAVRWSITPKVVTAPVIVAEPCTYDGGKALEPKLKVYDGDREIPANEYDAAFSDNTDAGTGNITITDREGGNYTVSGVGTFTIDKADYTGVKEAVVEVRYDKSNETSVTLPGIPDGAHYDEVYLGNAHYADGTDYPYFIFPSGKTRLEGSTLYITTDAVREAGVYADITVTVKDAKNYKDYEITVRTTCVEAVEVTISGLEDGQSFEYDGSAKAPAGTLTVSGGKVSADALTAHYNGTGDTAYDSAEAPAAAGSYTVTYSVPDSDTLYTGSVTYSFTIEPRSVTISGVTASDKVYDGSVEAEVSGSAVIERLVQGDDVSVETGRAAFESAGAGNGKNVTFSGFALKGDDAGNYTLFSQPAGVKANISPKVLELISVSVRDKVYDGTTAAEVVMAEFKGIVGTDKVGFTWSNVAFDDANAGSGKTVTGTLILAENVKNYTLADGAFTSHASIEKAEGSVTSPVGSTGLVYNGNEQQLLKTAAISADGEVQYRMPGEDYSTALPTAVNAGSYVVYYRVVGDRNHNDVEEQSIAVEISKATITITAVDKSMYVNSKLPSLDGAKLDRDYTVSGLVGEETLTQQPTLSYDPAKPDVSVAGDNAKIVASGAKASENYEIDYIDGTLVVSRSPSTSGVNYHTVKATADGNGTISPSGSVSVRDGRDQEFSITPDAGYEISDVKVDGKSIGAVDSYTFEEVGRSHTITVTFVKSGSRNVKFVDVPSGSYYAEAVTWAVENGITSGTDASHFAPNGICTRAQAVTFLWRAAGSPVVNYAMSFTDVSPDAYYAEAVRWAVSEGITKGTSETEFAPDAKCTRAQIVTFLWRSQKSPAADAESPFADVSADAYYAGAVSWAVSEGITNGVSKTAFGPDDVCTRAQIVTFIWRSMK